MAVGTGISLLKAGGGRSLLTYSTSGTLTESTSVAAVATPDPDNWGATGFLGGLTLTSSNALIDPYITDATYPTYTIRARLDGQYIDTSISGTVRPKIVDSQGIEGDTSGLINTTVNRVFQWGGITTLPLGNVTDNSVGILINTNVIQFFKADASNAITTVGGSYGTFFSDTSGSPANYNDVKIDVTGVGGAVAVFVSTANGSPATIGSTLTNDKSQGTYYAIRGGGLNQSVALRAVGSGGAVTINFTVTFRNQINTSKTFAQAFSLTFTKV
jgi:hypothetical protein